MDNDTIGWTNEDIIGYISYEYAHGRRTYFKKYDEFPVVDQSYEFPYTHLPSIFSIAVKILMEEDTTQVYSTNAEWDELTTVAESNDLTTMGNDIVGDTGSVTGRYLIYIKEC